MSIFNFVKRQPELLKKSQFYKGCITGGQDAMDWMGGSKTVMGFVTLLETIKKIKDK